MQLYIKSCMRTWRGDVAALLAGGVAVLAFAPFSMFWLALVSLLLLLASWQTVSLKRALWRGWLYGVGFFGGGVSWLAIPIANFGGLNFTLSLLLTAAFIAFIALYFAILGFFVAKYCPVAGNRRLLWLLLPALWTLLEWVRGWFLTGFPWLLMGYSQIDAPLAGYAPILGVYGVTWTTVLSAVLLWSALLAGNVRRLWLLLVLLWGLGAVLRMVSWGEVQDKTLDVALVQASIAQELKFEPSETAPSLQRYLRLSQEHLDADLIIWPETAIPIYWHQAQTFVARLQSLTAVSGVEFLIGVPEQRMTMDAIAKLNHVDYNSAVHLKSQQPPEFYRKQHLVPFGEYFPWQTQLAFLWHRLHIPLSDFSAGDAQQPLLSFNGVKAGIAICYEDAYSALMQASAREAGFLINISNDAWFGRSIAPQQHLQIARMRALELGRSLLRATNTGITAVIDPQGRVVVQSKQFEEVVIRAKIAVIAGGSWYASLGNSPLLIIISFCLMAGFGLRRYRYVS